MSNHLIYLFHNISIKANIIGTEGSIIWVILIIVYLFAYFTLIYRVKQILLFNLHKNMKNDETHKEFLKMNYKMHLYSRLHNSSARFKFLSNISVVCIIRELSNFCLYITVLSWILGYVLYISRY